MVSGIAGTANEFIYPQMIKYLVPEGAMGEAGIYGAIVKIGMVLMLFVQMYRLAAEPSSWPIIKNRTFCRCECRST